MKFEPAEQLFPPTRRRWADILTMLDGGNLVAAEKTRGSILDSEEIGR